MGFFSRLHFTNWERYKNTTLFSFSAGTLPSNVALFHNTTNAEFPIISLSHQFEANLPTKTSDENH
jgi:hypothetical protein